MDSVVFTQAGSAFTDGGTLKDEATASKLDTLCQRLVDRLAQTHR